MQEPVESGLTPLYHGYTKQKCFVAYSENAAWADDLLTTCEEILSLPEYNLEAEYARKYFHPHVPLRDKAAELIANARFGIYDLSSWQDSENRWYQPNNVFIELGIAIALNRPALLLLHASNSQRGWPGFLKSLRQHVVQWSGPTTLRQALEKRLPQWIKGNPERDWWNRYCIFGGRRCEYREVHPRAKQWGQQRLHCHVSAGYDQDRVDFRAVVDDVLGRYDDINFKYLNDLRLADGYQFLSCMHCQAVRSTPFAIYRISSDTFPETYIAIGISIGLEKQFGYSIPKILLTESPQVVPSLLSGYEVVDVKNHRDCKVRLGKFMPQVMQTVREIAWKPRTLPFIDAKVTDEEIDDPSITEAGNNPDNVHEPEVGDVIQGTIAAINQQGIIVDLGLKRDGIIPQSDLDKLEPEYHQAFKVTDEVSVYVVNTETPGSLILSLHRALLNLDWVNAETMMENSELFEGEVIDYNKGGAIVSFGRLKGFVPASHILGISAGMKDRQRQQHMAKLRHETIPLKVIEVDRRRRRLILSQREAQKGWGEKRREELLQDLSEGDIVKGTVSGLRDFGAFVDLGGSDGLIHISEMARHNITHPREVVEIGDEVTVYVLKVDQKTQRISLSLKKLITDPWSHIEQKYEVGQLVEGRIMRIADYGAFVEIESGLQGLLHRSQLARTSVENISDVVKEGETHLLRIVSIDGSRKRIGLSLKEVTTNEQIEWMAQKELEKAQKELEKESE